MGIPYIRADLLPEVNFTGTQLCNKSYSTYQNPTAPIAFVRNNTLGLSKLTASVDQNIWFTGVAVTLASSDYLKQLGSGRSSSCSDPVSLESIRRNRYW